MLPFISKITPAVQSPLPPKGEIEFFYKCKTRQFLICKGK